MARQKTGAPSVEKIVGPVIPKSAVERGGGEAAWRRGEFRFDEFGYFRKSPRKPCEWQQTGKPFPLGRVELDVVDEARSSDRLPAGPVIRLCHGANEVAPAVPVQDPFDAQEVARLYRDCVIEGGEHKSCAMKVLGEKRPGQPIVIAGVRKKTKRGQSAPKRKHSRKRSKR